MTSLSLLLLLLRLLWSMTTCRGTAVYSYSTHNVLHSPQHSPHRIQEIVDAAAERGIMTVFLMVAYSKSNRKNDPLDVLARTASARGLSLTFVRPGASASAFFWPAPRARWLPIGCAPWPLHRARKGECTQPPQVTKASLYSTLSVTRVVVFFSCVLVATSQIHYIIRFFPELCIPLSVSPVLVPDGGRLRSRCPPPRAGWCYCDGNVGGRCNDKKDFFVGDITGCRRRRAE